MFSHQVDNETKLILPLLHNAEELATVVQANLSHLKTWMPWATDDYSANSAQNYINENLQSLANGADFSMSVVYQNKIIGQIGFHDFSKLNKSVHLGYWIAAKMQGKGIITKCSRVFIDYAFNDLQLNRVQVNCNVENVKSRRIPERLGFRLEGTHRRAQWLHDKFVDMVVYAMLAEDWKKNRW